MGQKCLFDPRSCNSSGYPPHRPLKVRPRTKSFTYVPRNEIGLYYYFVNTEKIKLRQTRKKVNKMLIKPLQTSFIFNTVIISHLYGIYLNKLSISTFNRTEYNLIFFGHYYFTLCYCVLFRCRVYQKGKKLRCTHDHLTVPTLT